MSVLNVIILIEFGELCFLLINAMVLLLENLVNECVELHCINLI